MAQKLGIFRGTFTEQRDEIMKPPDTAHTIQRANKLDLQEYLHVLKSSGLAERRPVDDMERVKAMVSNANLVISARNKRGAMVGLARCVTDFAHSCYVADLAVDRSVQGLGLGAKLLAAVRAEIHPNCHCHLISAPGAIGFYEHLGFAPVTRGFEIHDVNAAK